MRRFLIDTIGRIDLVVWILVVLFFCGSSVLFDGNVQLAFIGAAGVIMEMLIIGFCVEIIIESLSKHKAIGTITGFITNGPEALCLIVGLAVGDILFAASTPLGSNFMNPLLLFIAAAVCSCFAPLLRCQPLYSFSTIGLTALFAGGFFLLNPRFYIFWMLAALLVSIPLFLFRPAEPESLAPEKDVYNPERWLIPAILILVGAGYFLDSVVSFAAEQSRAPKGVIGFFVLATLTSWPEFKSCLSLFNRGKILAAVLNITVSNITNIWLAAIGVGYSILMR